MHCQLWVKTFADAHGNGGQLLGRSLGLNRHFRCFSGWQYYHHLPGDFYRSGSCYFQCYFKSLGQKDQSKLAYHVTEALKITLLLSALLGALSLFAGQEMIGLLGTEQDVAESGGLYLSLVGGSIVLLGLMTSLGALIRATHNPRLPLYVSLYPMP